MWCKFPLVLLATIAGAYLLFGADEKKPARVAWTGSRVKGSPEPPPPFKFARAFPNVKFNHPLLMARCPGSDRLFVGEQDGKLWSFHNRPDAGAELFFDLRKELKTIHLLPEAKEVEAVYGLVFHPRFEQNQQCFVCYTLRPKVSKRNMENGTRVSRFTVTKTEPPRIDPASEEIVITFLQGGHNGGDLHFGPDGMLYISTGDATNPNPPDDLKTGQDLSDLLSSILRIDVDRKDEGKNYSVPKDNPFVAMKGARPEIWSYGFRNPWRMSFDRKTGQLYVGDVGWELWEMIFRVEKGGNYGWSATEGPQPIKPERAGPTPILPALIDLPHTISQSVTGGYVYRGKKFPELEGAYVFGDWESRRMWAARFDGDRLKEMPEITRPSLRLSAMGEDNAGELYALEYDAGTIHVLERNDGPGKNADFPTKLSATGLFASAKDHAPAAGVNRFEVNARQWQDGATAEYWAAFPGMSSGTLYPSGKPIPGVVDWRKFRIHFPRDAVLMKTISWEGKRVETQLLHFDGIDWRAYTFAWRDDQSDADLVPTDGAERVLGGGKRIWQFHSRTQCMSCHTTMSEIVLGFTPEQLNRLGASGRNQLVDFTASGLLDRAGDDGKPLPAFNDESVLKERKLADPADAAQALEARARAYLHVNCGHCHRPGGGGSVDLQLFASASNKELKAIGIRPTRGDFGLPDAHIIKPGEPWASTLLFRMAKYGRDRMPHLGAEVPDELGLRLVEDWIAGMKKDASPPKEEGLITSASALLSARAMARGELKPAQREHLLAEAGKLPHGPVRDLFEGYLPRDESAARKLGPNPRPASILAMKGDAARGEKSFWSEAMKCGTCHKIGDKGLSVGPELSVIGKQRSRADLLESLLQPSRRVEPRFAAYIARTTDGRTITGLLVQRDEKTVVLRDAQNKEIAIPAGEVEEVRPSRTSLMPDGQMANLTAQEAADLLEFLATRK